MHRADHRKRDHRMSTNTALAPNKPRKQALRRNGNSMKKTLATLAIAATFALTGCAPGPTAEPNEAPSGSRYHWEEHVELQDGRTVVCVTFKQGYGGGLSCDWAGAK